MEPFPKRQRLYTPRDSFFVHSFEEQHEYCETLDTELEDEEDEGDDNEPDEPIYDPEDELEQRRAQLDYKLKSTFEAIFEKYGKNFDGVGDEIDLATGEILVNNGHLLQMQDERDAGDISRARTMLRAFSVEPEDDMSSSLGDIALDVDEDDDQEEDEDEGEEEEENEDGEFSDDDVVEDDMILRGFAQASQFLHAEPSPEPTSSNEDFLEDSLEEQANPIASYVHESNGLPSRSDILAQFGPQLGPQIVDYISQKRAQDDSNIEPAWRVPDIPIPAHGRRPTLKSAVRKPEIERSLSPDTAPSLWAPAPTRGGGRNIRRESNAIFKDKRLDPIGYYGTLNSDHFESRSVPKKTRNRFTAEDDEILLDFVTKVRVRELGLAGESTWKQLEAMHPQHTWRSWSKHYRAKFTYLLNNQFEESEVSTSEASYSDHHKPIGGFDLNFASSMRFQRPQPVRRQRPTRVRKPVQKDSKIMSWSEAVNTIESLDPVLHAGILEDVRNSGRVPETLRHPISSLNSTGRYHPLQERPGSRNRIEQRPRADNTPMGLGSRFHTLPEGAGSQLSDHTKVHCSKFEENREPVPGGVPCPHADCRPYPDVLYRPERRHDEEQSQMCLHLIHVHRTTPFPCGELNCERTGDRGYFMQMDLVRHVKIAHPYIAALHRLRGRVDSHLLDQSYDHAKSRSLIEAHRNSAPEFPHRDSDFMSPRPPSNHQIQSSTEPVSSSPDHDRTLTPRGTSSRFEAASTPKTSVSSFNLNHSAAPAKVVREANDSRPAFFTSDKLMDIEGSYMNVNNAESNEKKYPSPLKESVECEKTITLTSSVSPFQRMHDDHVQSTEPGFQVTVSDSRVDNIKPHLEANNERSNLSAAANSRSPKSRPPPSPSIPDSQSSQEAVHSSPPPPLPRYSNSSRDIRITTHLARNTVDPSYEFSDEEMVLDSVVMRPPSLSTVRPTETPRPASGLRAMTPALKKKLQKSLCKTLDSEDFDELSLGRDDFVLISSPSKSACRAPPSSQNRIKLEPIDTPQGVLPATVRKRKVGMVQDNDELDELAAQAPLVFSQLGSFSKSQPQIKAGVSKSTATNAPKADVTDLGHQGFETKQDYKVRVNGTDLHPSSQLASTPTTQSTRNRNRRKDTVPSTRLLNLTSDRNKQTKSREMKGVNESAPETSISSSSSRLGSSPSARRTKSQDEAASLDTPLVDATLPAQKNVLSEREEEVAVLVKTPGGTLRRCGEDGFSCRRSFCFRCSNWRGGL